MTSTQPVVHVDKHLALAIYRDLEKVLISETLYFVVQVSDSDYNEPNTAGRIRTNT